MLNTNRKGSFPCIPVFLDFKLVEKLVVSVEKRLKLAARQAQRAAAQEQKGAEVIGPSVTLIDWEGHDFGNLFIQSHAVPAREWTEVSALEPDAMASLSSRIFEVQEEEWLKRKLEELR